MRLAFLIMAILLIGFSTPVVSADSNRIQINGVVDPTLTELIFLNSNHVVPEIFENDHHAINKCYRISNGYLTYISSEEGLFQGYELNKYIPSELTGMNLTLVDEKVQNKAGIRIGSLRKEVARIIKQDLFGIETSLSYESVKIIRGTPYDVITTVIIGFEKDELVKLLVITSTSN